MAKSRFLVYNVFCDIIRRVSADGGRIDAVYGYVRAAEGELKMREYELYRAFYCGLCREMGRRTGQSSRLSLSYDAAFFAIVRAAVLGENFTVSPRRCAVHPAKRRPAAGGCDSLDFTACAFAALASAKLDDTRADERGGAKLAAISARPVASRWEKRADRRYDGVVGVIGDGLSKLTALEEQRSASLDDTSEAFGGMLGELASFGTDGTERRILREIGDLTGRFVYVCDACDDAAQDAKKGRYNPLVEIYGTDLCEKREVLGLDRKIKEREVLRADVASQIKPAAMMLVSRLDSAVGLIDFDRNPSLEGIVKNVVRIGMPGQLRRVLGQVRGDKSSPIDGGENEETDGKETEK